MNKAFFIFSIVAFCFSCTSKAPEPFNSLSSGSPSIEGKAEYMASPYVTAGDRLYVVGHQDGSFPELGWHIKGEMGGIWNHPIKLMDGFSIEVSDGNATEILHNATSFINYPFGNKMRFDLESIGLKAERWQFVPDGKEGMIVQLSLKNETNNLKPISVKFSCAVDLRPTWLGERTDMIDTQDQLSFDTSLNTWVAKDSLNPWYTIFGSDQKLISKSRESSPFSGKGSSALLEYSLEIEANATRTINFFISGSYTSEAQAKATFQDISANYSTYFTLKRDRYEQLANRSKLTIPDKDIEQAFEWLKYNSDWLIRTVPEIGSGIGAGLPDYPWWFGVDSEYALQGYMMIGQRTAVYNTIALLDTVSNKVNGNGRIIHEMSTNGAVFNEGNINETPQFASLIWKIYQWNGDIAFLEKYFPTVKKGLHWLMTEKDANGNLFPDGFGMMEIHGLDSEMIDVAAYTQKALADASKMALVLNDTTLSKKYAEMAAILQIKINTEFWSEEFNSFADFIGTDEQALHLIDAAIVRADTLNKPWAVAELKQTRDAILKNPSDQARPFVLHHNWVVNTPMEIGVADHDKAIKALNSAEKYVNPFGVFVTGIDRDDSAGSDDGSFKGSKIFSYTGAVMTLPTGVQVVSENNYGRPDHALNYLKRMTRTFSYALPGSMYEVSPDYGMVTQAWNIYGFAVPIVEQFFGIKPDAASKTIEIRPHLPGSWKDASLENVLIGDNEVSIFIKESDGTRTIRVDQTSSNWTIMLDLPVSEVSQITKKNGRVEISTTPGSTYYSVRSRDKSFEITYKL